MSLVSSVGRPCARSIRKRSGSTRPKRNAGVWKPRPTLFGVSQIPALPCPRKRPPPTLPRLRGRVGWGHPHRRQQAPIGAPASDLPDRPGLTDSTQTLPTLGTCLPWDRGRLARSFLAKPFLCQAKGRRDARGTSVAGDARNPTRPVRSLVLEWQL